MKDLTLKRNFNSISEDFKKGNYNLQTISNLIVKVRQYRNELTQEEASLLLEIPINILENDVELINEKAWVSTNSGYFYGNITWVDSDFYNKIKNDFKDSNFSLNTIIELTKNVKDDFKELGGAVDFLLRNTEVTLRDDVRLHGYSNFEKSGNVFSDHVYKAINM